MVGVGLLTAALVLPWLVNAARSAQARPTRRRRTTGRGDSRMALWVIWLIIAVVLGVAEIFTLTAALGLLGGAALITAGVRRGRAAAARCSSWCSPSPPTAGVVLVRPVALRHMLAPAGAAVRRGRAGRQAGLRRRRR